MRGWSLVAGLVLVSFTFNVPTITAQQGQQSRRPPGPMVRVPFEPVAIVTSLLMIKEMLFNLDGHYVDIRGAIVEQIISRRALVIEDPQDGGTHSLLLFETPIAPPPEECAIDVRGYVYSALGVRRQPALSGVGDELLEHFHHRPIIVAGVVSTLEGLPLYSRFPAAGQQNRPLVP